jgi:hypothetical protein
MKNPASIHTHIHTHIHTYAHTHVCTNRKKGQALKRMKNPASILKAIKPNTGFGAEASKSNINQMGYKKIEDIEQ